MQKNFAVGFENVDIDNGFWQDKQKLNSEAILFAVWERFKETGRFDAFKFDWKEGMPHKPHIFWDSDIAKWVEAVAYVVLKKRDEKLEQAVDELVDLIEKNQDGTGYFNVYFTVVEPDKRWTKRTEHELYCAGHLIEAAVAYYNATKRDKFLKLMCSYADHIEKVFKIERTAAFITPGHEEIELALVRLYHCTGEKRYLELSKFFIDNRGKDDPSMYYPWANSRYAQDHLPVREQSTAEGHSVRAVYLYCGMADIAYEYEDHELFNACRRIFENMAYKKMYITGGIGSSSNGEAFTIDYDLPNQSAYAESCAGIGLVMFTKRMLLMDADAFYANIAERAIYNGFLSSTSLDGTAFFYENPLEIDPKLHNRDICIGDGRTRFPSMERQKVFECSCCPPNISRFIASFGDLLYTYNNNTIYINHYANSISNFNICGKDIGIKQETKYPNDGNISINAKGVMGMALSIRVPYWCENFKIQSNGSDASYELHKGYAYIKCPNDTIVLDIEFEMKPQLIEASPNVQENSGRVALQMGPIVYCLEGIDNGSNLRDIAICEALDLKMKYDEVLGLDVIEAKGYRRDPENFAELYQPLKNKYIPQILKFIPYYAFANRGQTEMIVWTLKMK